MLIILYNMRQALWSIKLKALKHWGYTCKKEYLSNLFGIPCQKKQTIKGKNFYSKSKFSFFFQNRYNFG